MKARENEKIEKRAGEEVKIVIRGRDEEGKEKSE